MRKSIMLSCTIMLIILFVALTTTTFAWYQAAAGEIEISGADSVTVSTTGPDSPYLIISKTSNASIGSTGKTFNNVTSSDIESGSPYLLTSVLKENADSWTWASSLGVYSVTTAGTFSDTGFTEISSGLTSSNPKVFTFYIRNTSASFDLTADLAVVDANISHYCWAVAFGDQKANSAYHTTAGGSAQSASSSVTIPHCALGSTIEVNVYIWVDSYVDNSSTLVSNSSEVATHLSTYALSDVTVEFSNIAIKTS